MNLRDFGSTLARWWYLTLATVLLALGAAMGVYQTAGPTYTAQSTVLLLPPKAVLLAAAEDKKNYAPNNPLLYLGQLTDARDVMVRYLTSKDVTDALAKQVPSAKVTVATDVTSQSPLILITADGNDEATALAGMKAIDKMVPDSLKSFQDQMKIQDLQRITSLHVTEDTKGTAVHKKQIELAAVSFAGVTLLGLVAIALLDNLRRRRNGEAVAVTDGATEAPRTQRRADRKATQA